MPFAVFDVETRVDKHLLNQVYFEGQKLTDDEAFHRYSDELRNRAMVEAHTKIANILAKFDLIVREAAESGKSVKSAEAMRLQVKDIQQNMIRRM